MLGAPHARAPHARAHNTTYHQTLSEAIYLLQLLLRPKLVGVATLLLPAVRRTRWQTRVALPANHLVAVVL